MINTNPSCPFEVGFFGFHYKGLLHNHIDSQVYFYGGFEKSELYLLRDVALKYKDPICLDIGANIGHHSLFLSRYCKTVHSFEPYEKVRSSLVDKISYNHISNIIVHPLALGSTDQTLTYYPPETDNEGTGSFVTHNRNSSDSLELQVVEGDTYLKEQKIDKIDLIKIDVEGFEKEVLLGLRETLMKNRPTIMMEFSSDTKKTFENEKSIFEILPPNYKIQAIIPYRSFLFFFNIPSYRLVDFNFDMKAGLNLVLTPQ
ncbi:MAG: FkbM family methyltransferase [Patescibacteria group bacterium]